MIVAAHCKFCHCDLNLVVDDDYAAIGDRFKLIEIASCNRCHDLRVMRRNIGDGVKSICIIILNSDGAAQQTVRESLRGSLSTLLRSWMGLAEDWKHNEGPEFDEAALDGLLNDPRQYPDVLKRLWDMVQYPGQKGLW